VREDEVDQTSVALSYENTTYWHRLFRSVVGLRADAYFFDVESKTIVDNLDSEDDQIVSPKGSLIFGPVRDTEFYLSGGFGFHSNDGRGTTTVIDPNTGERVEPVDPLVRSTGGEIGLRTTALPGLHSRGAAHDSRFPEPAVLSGGASGAH